MTMTIKIRGRQVEMQVVDRQTVNPAELPHLYSRGVREIVSLQGPKGGNFRQVWINEDGTRTIIGG